MDNPIQTLQGPLWQAAERVPDDLRAEAAQDALDVMAVAAGWKPVAIVGCGYHAPAFVADVRRAADASGLETVEGPLWRETGEASGLPRWYGDSLAKIIGDVRVLFVARQTLTGMPGRALTATEEAALLGYPDCCVSEYHRRRRLYHLVMVRAIRRQTEGDQERARRLAESQVILTPRSERERRQLARATRSIFLSFASFAICGTCEAEADSPARQLSERYRRLIADAELERLASLVDPA